MVRSIRTLGSAPSLGDETVIWEAFKPGEAPNDEFSVVDIDGNVVQPSERCDRAPPAR